MAELAHRIPLDIKLWHTTEPLDFFLDQCPAQVRAQFDPGWHPRRQYEYAASRFLLYRMVDPALVLHSTPRGAPFFADTDLAVSISHCQGYVGVLLGQTAVGLDLEQTLVPRNWNTARVFMNEEELRHYESDRSPATFLEVWCAKECLYKVLNTDWPDLSFKRQLWVQPSPTPGAVFPRQLPGGLRRQEIERSYLVHIDQPVPDLIVAATTGEPIPTPVP
ncbi:MAG: 4'-phosphopantetheinyl transferase superfamily protein [Bacteroidetes bacterium]|jgi:hypothetical protein|nr:4'-phosphopantetheinyl transferase superfamily protein [Bacteroidota bacterium]